MKGIFWHMYYVIRKFGYCAFQKCYSEHNPSLYSLSLSFSPSTSKSSWATIHCLLGTRAPWHGPKKQTNIIYPPDSVLQPISGLPRHTLARDTAILCGRASQDRVRMSPVLFTFFISSAHIPLFPEVRARDTQKPLCDYFATMASRRAVCIQGLSSNPFSSLPASETTDWK